MEVFYFSRVLGKYRGENKPGGNGQSYFLASYFLPLIKFLPLLKQIIFKFGLICHKLYPDWRPSFFSVSPKTFNTLPWRPLIIPTRLAKSFRRCYNYQVLLLFHIVMSTSPIVQFDYWLIRILFNLIITSEIKSFYIKQIIKFDWSKKDY